MQLSDSKTLENLKTAFANEAATRQSPTATRKYHRYSAPQQKTKELMQSFGSDLFSEVSRKQPKHLKKPLTAKTTNGRRCIRNMPKLQGRRSSTI